MIEKVAGALAVIAIVAAVGGYFSLERRMSALEGERLLPEGTMLPYVGSEGSSAALEGWVQCGGQGTPEMAGRFLVGTSEAGKAGDLLGEPTLDRPATLRSSYEKEGTTAGPEGADNETGHPNWNHKHDIEIPAVQVVFFCKPSKE